jgi:hypothetical protein
MAHRDYSEDEDYFTQDFVRDGIVSVWIGLSDCSSDMNTDVLQDLCGVGYYSLDNQEGNNFDFQLLPVCVLLKELSYSSSFIEVAVEKANTMGLRQARWAVVQYDFEYSPTKVKRNIAADPVFIGTFEYSMQEKRDS